MATNNCQYSTRYCWDADKVKALIRLRAELSPLFTGKRNASKYAWAVVERELNVPLPLSKIIKKWNNLLQEYKAIKMSEEPKRREWPFFTLMDVYFSDQVNDPSLRLFSSTKTLKESLDESVFEDDPIIASAIAAATSGACMEIEELLKRQKERRANENKFDKNCSSKATDYSIHGNKPNVVTVKNTNFIQQQDNIKNHKQLPDQQDVVKHETVMPPRPTFLQQQSPPSQTIQNKYADPNTIDQYLLSWNNFLGNMSRGFHTLQKDAKMVDVTIAAGGKIFKAHKLVLSVCSPYFQEIFLENPSNHPILLMADVEANHMAGLLNFMYSGQVNVKYEDLPAFLKVAEAMKIKGLHTEKPEGQQLKEIQFSRDDSTTDFQVLNSSSLPIPVDITRQPLPTSLSKEEDGTCHATFYSSDHTKNSEPFHHNMNPVNFEQTKNKFSILKTNASKQILDHAKQQKYLAKRKAFAHCETELKEKRMAEVSENDPYNKPHPKMLYMPLMTSHAGDNFNNNNEEVLNLAQNGVPNISSKLVPINSADLKKSCQYNQTIFTEIRKDNRIAACGVDDEMSSFVAKSCEDGNNNICNEETISSKNHSFSTKDKIAFNKNDNNKQSDNRTCNININNDDNNNNDSYSTDNNSNQNSNQNANNKLNSNDANNNDCTNKSNEMKTSLPRKHADNNNNVFVNSNSSPDLKENESNTDSVKFKVPINTCSSLY